MRVLVVGAGGQGAPCASILAKDKEVSAVVLGDIDVDLLSKVKDRIRSDKIETIQLDAGQIEEIEMAATGVDAIINLAGENISTGRWTGERKRAILESRLNAGRAIVEAVEIATRKPHVAIQASGVGYYGPCGD